MAIDSQIELNTKPNETGRKEHRSHPRLIVFLVCLVISILMWLFIELMKDYTDEIKYNVSFINAPRDLILTHSGDSVISVGMNAQGFELLAAKYAHKLRGLTIDLSTLKIRPTADGYIAYLPSSRIVDQLGTQIRFEKQITYIKPDTLFFRFSKIFVKQVPVKLDLDYSLNGQYDITDSITYRPQFVSVSSIKSIIDTLSFIKTQKLQLSQLDSSVTIKVALKKGYRASLLKFSTDSVTVKFKVEKVTEAGYTVPVSVSGNGENVKIFPDKVEIVCRIPLSVYPHITASDFSAEVEFQPASLKEKKLKVTLIKIPKKVRVLKISPAEVEYIIISK
ncbi:MAG: CdaR family protein [Bacteroidales bacterium]|nr:CdaR family protein [Bacteroidales bacterium]